MVSVIMKDTAILIISLAADRQAVTIFKEREADLKTMDALVHKHLDTHSDTAGAIHRIRTEAGLAAILGQAVLAVYQE